MTSRTCFADFLYICIKNNLFLSPACKLSSQSHSPGIGVDQCCVVDWFSPDNLTQA